MIVTLKRLVDFPDCTIGQLRPSGFYTLEPSWGSRIPEGTYDVVKDEDTRRFRVPDRTGIFIHAGNDTEGGILVGLGTGYLGRDVAVLHSEYALEELWKETPDKFLLKIEYPYAPSQIKERRS